MSARISFVLTLVTLAAAAAPFQSQEPVRFSELERARIAGLSPLPPLPPDPTNAWADDPAAARFGQQLFFDPRFSKSGEIACATCHVPDKGFADGLSLGRGLAELPRHSPTLLNVGYQRWLFHDGRADSLWAQALQPFENELEMGTSRLGVLHRIASDAALSEQYASIFGALPELSDSERFPAHARPAGPGSKHPHALAWRAMGEEDRELVNRAYSNLGKAIAAYERRLVGGTSAFDRFARGLAEGDARQQAAMSASAQRGLKLFIGKAGCRLCHVGPLFSDGEFHDLGLAPLKGGKRTDPGRHAGVDLVLRDPFNAVSVYSDAARDADRSRAADKLEFLARGPELWGQFKTPTLRNVARTAPYMHQGQFASLRDVLHFYSTLEGAAPAGHHQETTLVPLALEPGELEDLEAFLEALTDEPLDPALTEPPAG